MLKTWRREVYKTKEELARELGMSRSTLYRRIAKANIPISGELLSPSEQEILIRTIESHQKRRYTARRFNDRAPDETN
ncbi:MAG: hypothetical protein KIS77_21825 [Saprospiraceae bacterium]|nr:hypothetical protein [Saprospiraceae bacterium]